MCHSVGKGGPKSYNYFIVFDPRMGLLPLVVMHVKNSLNLEGNSEADVYPAAARI